MSTLTKYLKKKTVKTDKFQLRVLPIANFDPESSLFQRFKVINPNLESFKLLKIFAITEKVNMRGTE